jgi:predicted Holliday junction resolvase-like endonuclease
MRFIQKSVAASLVVIVMTIVAFRQSREIAALRREIAKQSTPQLELPHESVSLEIQEKCEQRSAQAFKEWGSERSATYTSHYSSKDSKCFIEIATTKVENGVPMVFRQVSDAFGGRSFGQYSWINSQHIACL